MSDPPRIGYRPNIYAKPQPKNSAPPAPRPPVPSSRNRMLKPGFETASTPYSRPPSVKTQEKSPEPPPRKLEPYPVLSNFMFTEQQLKDTPSLRQHNIPYEEEITLRRAGTFFIKELCRRLNIPFVQKSAKISARAMCVSMVYFHRFYMFHSLTTFDPVYLGTACLFLAAKCEECPRKLSHFSKQLYSMLHPEDPHLLENDELEPMNDLITAFESAVLRTVAFELNIELPHVDIIQAPFTSTGDRLRKMAYHLTTDLLTTSTLCIQHESKTLAAVCFFVAACYLDIDMDKDYGEKWFLKLDTNLTEDVLVKIAKCFTTCLTDSKFIFNAERLPRPVEPSRSESSKRPSEPQSQLPSESQVHDASKVIRQHRENRTREAANSHEHRRPPSSDASRERALPKEHRLSEPSKKERHRAPYDQSRDRSTDVINKDRPRAPYERETPVTTQQSHSTVPQQRRTPEESSLPNRPKGRRTPEPLESSRTSEAASKTIVNTKNAGRTPCYEHERPSRGRRTPELPPQERPQKSSRTPEAASEGTLNTKYAGRTPENEYSRHSRGRRTPELPQQEPHRTPELQLQGRPQKSSRTSVAASETTVNTKNAGHTPENEHGRHFRGRRTPELPPQERPKKSSRTPEAASEGTVNTKNAGHTPENEHGRHFRGRRTTELSQQERPKKSLRTPEAASEGTFNTKYAGHTPENEYSTHHRGRRTPELPTQESAKKSSRTPEGPAYESDKQPRERRTPELPQPRLKVPGEQSVETVSESRGQDDHASVSYSRRTPEVSNLEQMREYGSNKSLAKIPMASSHGRQKPLLEKPKHERSWEGQSYEGRSQDLEAPLLVPPPLPPPSSELRIKRKIAFDEEVPQKRSVDVSVSSTSAKKQFEQVDFSLPPPPLPPPQDRRFSIPIRVHGEALRKNNNVSKVSTYSTAPQQQQSSQNDYKRDETRHRQPNTYNQSGRSSKDSSLQRSQQQRDVCKHDMMQNFVPAQTHSAKTFNRHLDKSPTHDLEEGEIE